MTLASQTCAHHPERIGFALCMACRKTVCQECATTWDGVNHCRPCLVRLRAAAGQRVTAFAWVAFAASALVMFAAAGFALAWSSSLWARLL